MDSNNTCHVTAASCAAMREYVQFLEAKAKDLLDKAKALRAALTILETDFVPRTQAQAVPPTPEVKSDSKKKKPGQATASAGSQSDHSAYIRDEGVATRGKRSTLRPRAADEAIAKAPTRFTARDIRAVLKIIHPDVEKTMRGTYVTNHLNSRTKSGMIRRVGKADDGHTVVYEKL